MIFMYLPVLVMILRMFKIAYPEDYMLIRFKLNAFLIFYEIFLLTRTIDYGYREWIEYESYGRWTELIYYMLEMMLI